MEVPYGQSKKDTEGYRSRALASFDVICDEIGEENAMNIFEPFIRCASSALRVDEGMLFFNALNILSDRLEAYQRRLADLDMVMIH